MNHTRGLVMSDARLHYDVCTPQHSCLNIFTLHRLASHQDVNVDPGVITDMRNGKGLLAIMSVRLIVYPVIIQKGRNLGYEFVAS